MIRRICAPILLLLATLFLGGCFFDQPLTSTPSKDINTWLLGVWEHKDEKEKLYRATIMPLSGDRYSVRFEIPAKNKKESKMWLFEGWISRVGKGNFLTLKCLESSGEIPPDGFVFLHYQVLNQTHFAIRKLLLDSPQDTSSFLLRKEVRQKQKDQTLYEPGAGVIWAKVSEVYWDPNSDAPQPFQPLRNPDPVKKTE